MSLEKILNEHRDLLNALVETVQRTQEDVESIHQMVEVIRAAQVEHGKALGELELKVGQCQWRRARGSTGPSSPPPLKRIEATK